MTESNLFLISCVHGLYFINIYNLLFLTKE